VVAISSLSHLARVGLAAYAEDLVEVLARLERIFGGHVRPVHGLIMPGTEVKDDFLTRQLHDLYTWLQDVVKRKRFTTPAAYEALLSRTIRGEPSFFDRNKLNDLLIPYRLPASLATRDRVATMTCPTGVIRGTWAVMSEEDKLWATRALIEEVSTEYSVNPRPKIGGTTERQQTKSLTYIVAGGSHASRLAGSLIKAKADVRDVTQGGWRLDKDRIKNMAEDIQTALDSTEQEKAVLILHMLDNDLYIGVEDGQYMGRAFKGADHRYHIKGMLGICTEEMLKDTFIKAMPIFRAGKEVPTILVGPLPRYTMAKCCRSSAHITNFSMSSFGNDVAKGVKEVGKQLKRLIFYRGMKNVTLLNPNVALRAAASSGDEVAALWGEDPVHPKQEVYQAIARDVMSKASESHTKWAALQAAKSAKRRRSDSADGLSDDSSVVEVGGHAAASDRSGSHHSGAGVVIGRRQRSTPEGDPDRSSGHYRGASYRGGWTRGGGRSRYRSGYY